MPEHPPSQPICIPNRRLPFVTVSGELNVGPFRASALLDALFIPTRRCSSALFDSLPEIANAATRVFILPSGPASQSLSTTTLPNNVTIVEHFLTTNIL